jgi:hypothetical protein
MLMGIGVNFVTLMQRNGVKMNLNDKDKAQIRSWLFELLAQLETCDDVSGEKSEQDSTVTIKVKFINTLSNSRQNFLNK